jgi:hypothetical protein
MEGNAKCRHLKKLTCTGTLCGRYFVCLRPPPLLGFYLGWSSDVVGSESGQIQSVKFLQNKVSNTTHTHCICKYVQYTSHTEKVGRGARVEP